MANDNDDACLRAVRAHSCDEVRKLCTLGVAGTQLVPLYDVVCSLDNVAQPVTLIAAAAYILMLLSVLGTTAGSFFVPQLDRASAALRLSPTVAGLTLLALGNAAPDVFADVAGAEDSDLALDIGELLGAAVFITTVVLAAVVLVSTTRTRNYVSVGHIPTFARDVAVCATAMTLVMVNAALGSFHLITALCLVGSYGVYVLVVVLCSKGRDADKEDDVENDLGEPLLGDSVNDEPPPPLTGLTWTEDSGVLERIQVIVEWPMTLTRWLSVPNPDGAGGAARRRLMGVAPLGACAVVFLAFTSIICPNCASPYDVFQMQVPLRIAGWQPPAFALGAAAAILLGVLALACPRLAAVPVGIVSFVSVVAWMSLAGNELVAALEVGGRLTGLSSTLMGATFLAWGNSVGDMVANVSVARAGYPAMAFGSALGAPLLTACIGLGLAAVVSTAAPPHWVRVHVSRGAWVATCFLAASLTLTGGYAIFTGFLTRKLAYLLIVIYVAFTAALLTVEFV
ncbi:sodium/potassium/calcium exchanger [Pseudoscourfieldia marina]